MGLFINGSYVEKSYNDDYYSNDGEYFSQTYIIPYAGSFSICVKGRNVPGSEAGILKPSKTVTIQGTDENGTTIGPAPNPIPTNTGMVTVNGKQYKIYVPEYNSSGSNANFENSGWSTIKTIPFSSRETNWANLIAGISMEGIEDGFQEYAGVTATQQFAAMSFVAALIDAYKKNTVVTYIRIAIQRSGSEYRAVVQFGTSNNELKNRAGSSYYYSDLKSYTDVNGVTWGKSEAQEMVKNAFLWTDDDKTYDILISIDSGHGSDPYMGYLSVNTNGKLVFTPKLYTEDDEVVGHYTGFLGLGWEEDAGMRSTMEMSGVLPDEFKTAVNGMIGTSVEFTGTN